MKIKKLYYFFLHFLFLTGIFYAFGQFITTPRIEMLERRLWAYESWIILSFYGLFAYLTITEKEIGMKRLKKGGKKIQTKLHLDEFKRILTVNIILLVFPWGLFLIFAPPDLLEILRLESAFWRLLGVFSLLGAGLYYLPFRNYKSRFTRLILDFGAIDNLIAGLILTVLFLTKNISLLQWSSAPLLLYFAYFFREQSLKHKHIVKNINKK